MLSFLQCGALFHFKSVAINYILMRTQILIYCSQKFLIVNGKKKKFILCTKSYENSENTNFKHWCQLQIRNFNILLIKGFNKLIHDSNKIK